LGELIYIVFRKRDAPRAGGASAGSDPRWISPFEWAIPCREEGVTQLSDSRAKGLQTPKEKDSVGPTNRAHTSQIKVTTRVIFQENVPKLLRLEHVFAGIHMRELIEQSRIG